MSKENRKDLEERIRKMTAKISRLQTKADEALANKEHRRHLLARLAIDRAEKQLQALQQRLRYARK